MLELLSARARESRAAVHFYEDYARVESLSAADLLSRAKIFASGLPAPERQGECLLISLPNTSRFPAAFFGALLRGYTPVPLAVPELMRPRDYSELLARVAQVTEARVFVSTREGISRAPRFAHPIEAASLRGGGAFVESRPRPEDVALIQFSSGSTGSPKGVMLTHAAIRANLEMIRLGMRAGPSDTGCSWLPFYHDMGWIGGFLSPLEAGYPVHVFSPFDFVASPYRWLKLVSDVNATFILGPDFAYRTCLKKVSHEQARQLDLSRVRLALSGAEPVSAGTCRQFIEKFAVSGFSKTALFPVYGLAENSLAVTFPAPGSELKSTTRDGIEVVSCGKPLPGVQLRIGSEGRILIKSPSMTTGYYKDEESTRALFEDSWLVTGDLGFLEQGELHITGREKDLIILNGRNIHPGDLERRAASVQGLRFGRLAAVSVAQGAEGEAIRLVAECKEALPWRRNRLRRELAARVSELSPVGVSQVLLVPPCLIPRTSSGKTRRFELKRMIESGAVARAQRGFLFKLALSRLEFAQLVFKVLSTKFTQQLSARVDRARAMIVAWRAPLEARLDTHLAHRLAEALGTPATGISPETPFTAYHLDSLGLIRLHAALKGDFGPIELHELIGIANLLELRTYLMNAHRHAVEEWSQSHGSPRNRDSRDGQTGRDSVAEAPADVQAGGHRLDEARRSHENVESGRDRSAHLSSQLREAEPGAAAPL